ncbi:MAG: hypothetical protein HY974_00820 [Candidatus Kerfeldbacteria bacterium]|nr:hypothetical protein [Candidatus Kerfeldbacteria bacterium]
MFFKEVSHGQVLVEALLGIVVSTAMLAGSAALINSSLKLNKEGGKGSAALALAQEGMEAVQAIRDTSWHNLYNPPDGAGASSNKGASYPYYVGKSGTTWVLTTDTADKDITVDGLVYSRVVQIDNVSRDNSTRDIVTSGGTNDPATQKVTVTVTATGSADVALVQYFTRVYTHSPWQQSSWAGGSGQTSWSDTAKYDTDDGNVNVTGTVGTIKLEAQ